jgi:hypothetical protein
MSPLSSSKVMVVRTVDLCRLRVGRQFSYVVLLYLKNKLPNKNHLLTIGNGHPANPRHTHSSGGAHPLLLRSLSLGQ